MLLLLVLMTVSVGTDGTSTVELVYDVPREAADRELTFTLLEPDGVRVRDLFAGSASVALDRSEAPRLRGRADLEAGATSATFRYESSATVFPVVVVEGLALESRADAFRATIELPDGTQLVESFPTGMKRLGASRYALELPVVPAFVRLRTSESDSVLTWPRILDGGVLVLLALLAFVAIRRR